MDLTPPYLASPLGQASLKGISKLIHPKQKFWSLALITKEYISFYPHHLLSAHGTTILLICSSQKPMSSLTQFALLLFTSNRSASSISVQKIMYLIHSLLSTSIDTVLVQDTITSCLCSLRPLQAPCFHSSPRSSRMNFQKNKSHHVILCLYSTVFPIIRRKL